MRADPLCWKVELRDWGFELQLGERTCFRWRWTDVREARWDWSEPPDTTATLYATPNGSINAQLRVNVVARGTIQFIEHNGTSTSLRIVLDWGRETHRPLIEKILQLQLDKLPLAPILPLLTG
jgi:hypothetical protein